MVDAVLLMDMPESCRECMVRSLADDCQATGRYVQEYRERKTKPAWCPLIELPKRMPETASRKCKGSCEGEWEIPIPENKGWNACLDAILSHD